MRRTAGAALALAAGAHALPAGAVASQRLARALGLQTHLDDPEGVALTFDDGPHPDGTPAMLEALAQLDAVATFFLTGEQVARHPDIARAVVRAGHDVGVHGYRHLLLTLRTPAAAAEDLRKARTAIERATGATPRLYRPPYGVASPAALLAARRLGLRPVLWSRWARDWERRATAASVAALATADLRGGEIVLLHDADHYAAPGSWRATLGALPAIVAAARRSRLSLRTL